MKPNYAAYLNDEKLLKQFAETGNQANINDPIVLAKFVKGNAAWYIYSFSAETGLCNTYYSWFEHKWFAALSIQDLFMQSAVRDKSFIPCRLSEIKNLNASTNAFATGHQVV